MGIKCVLISRVGIIICRKLTESLLCCSDQTRNWHRTAESLPPVCAWDCEAASFPQLGFACFMRRVESERFKERGAQISAGPTSRSMWCCMWQHTCHLCSADKGQVCWSTLSLIKVLKGPEDTGLGSQRSSNQQARDKNLCSPPWTRFALLVRVFFMHFGVLKV